jgi:hypothetical protein
VREEYFIHALCLSYIVNVFPLCSFVVVSFVLYTFLLFPGRRMEMKKDVTVQTAYLLNSALYWIEWCIFLNV